VQLHNAFCKSVCLDVNCRTCNCVSTWGSGLQLLPRRFCLARGMRGFGSGLLCETDLLESDPEVPGPAWAAAGTGTPPNDMRLR
jgi:hypothetical protein